MSEKNDRAVCNMCGKYFTPSYNDGKDVEGFCPNCLLTLTDREPPAIKRQKLTSTKNWRNFRITLEWMIFIVCLLIITVRLPKIFISMEATKPIRRGTYGTDSATDHCIGNLWYIASQLQEHRELVNSITCPVSKKPYIIRKIDGDIAAECLNPGLHKLKLLKVSRDKPIPDVR